jgi:hypothetical protein
MVAETAVLTDCNICLCCAEQLVSQLSLIGTSIRSWVSAAPVFHAAEGCVRGLLHMQQQRIPPRCSQIPVQPPPFLRAELVSLQLCAHASGLGEVHMSIGCDADSTLNHEAVSNAGSPEWLAQRVALSGSLQQYNKTLSFQSRGDALSERMPSLHLQHSMMEATHTQPQADAIYCGADIRTEVACLRLWLPAPASARRGRGAPGVATGPPVSCPVAKWQARKWPRTTASLPLSARRLPAQHTRRFWPGLQLDKVQA